MTEFEGQIFNEGVNDVDFDRDQDEANSQDLSWIKELVRGEKQREEAGVVDFSPAFDPKNLVMKETIDFLKVLKLSFIKNATYFNQLKGPSEGHIKVYGISKTHTDFMLFRNGYKLIFSMTKPGQIVIKFHHLSTPFINNDYNQVESEQIIKSPIPQTALEARWGAFNELVWTHAEKRINVEYLVKFYIKNFVHSSTK